MAESEIQPCVRCGRGIKAPGGITVTGDQAIAIYMECMTVGFRPRITSGKFRESMCVQCAVSLSFGPTPQGAFNEKVYEMLRNVLRQDPTIVQAAQSLLVNPRALRPLMPGSIPDKNLDVPALYTPGLLQAAI
jgi:hypothetical protein